MPASPPVPRGSAFIWYHADAGHLDAIRAWLARLAREPGLNVRLMLRQEKGKTTFMEIYEHIESPQLKHIESMAKGEACFAGIERRCEFFTEVSLNECP